MVAIPIYARYSNQNKVLDQVATFSKEGNLIFNDEGNDLKAHLITATKFALLTAASPLITLARLVRSAAFVYTENFLQSKREFIGALMTPLIAATSLAGTLLSSLVYIITGGGVSFYTSMRRTYASFEAWVNLVDLNHSKLPSYSNRVSSPTDACKRIWTTAPCMQPLLENGNTSWWPWKNHGGLLDAKRMQKIFPFIPVNNVKMEGDKVVLQSHYSEEDVHYIGCNGAFEHRRVSTDCCCCWRIDAVLDRCLCCEISKGSCTSKLNHGDSCGYVGCSACGVGACCCYSTKDHQLETVSSGCLGPGGIGSIIALQRV